MENTNANQINFDYNGKHYCLEYTLDTIKQMEAAGFNMNDFDARPATRIEQLWNGAFLANCRGVSSNIKNELFKKMKDKDGLVKALSDMYTNTLNNLLPATEDDSGNVEWTATT